MSYCIDVGSYTAPSGIITGYQSQNLAINTGLYTAPSGIECYPNGFRELNVANNTTEISLFQSWWSEQINQYGIEAYYFIHGYQLSAHDYIYGEQPLAPYFPPIKMVIAAEISNDSLIFSKYGLQGQADLTAYIAVSSFYSSTSAYQDQNSYTIPAPRLEPKSGDLIFLAEPGFGRPGGRAGDVYEITERRDQQAGQTTNQLMGHYVWLLRAKRYDYSFEPKSRKENLINQVYDSMVYILSAIGNPLGIVGPTISTITSGGITDSGNPIDAPDSTSVDYSALSADNGIGCNPGPLRYLEKTNNYWERQLYDNYWTEQTNFYGISIAYYVNLTSLSGIDLQYGEQPMAGFAPPLMMIMMVELNKDNLILSKFGLESDADMTSIVPIQTFYNYTSAFGPYYEPKSGDLIQLVEYGTTRFGGRTGEVFEITERVDQRLTINQLMGHYVWMIKGKRFDYSYDTESAPREGAMDQVYDNKSEGFLQPDLLPYVVETKQYPQFVDKDSKKVFDYNANTASNNSVYGEYDNNTILVNPIGITDNTQSNSVSALAISDDGTDVTIAVAISPNN